MKMISSKAGTRLAKARAAVTESKQQDIPLIERYRIHGEFEQAAEALADELIADGHHLQEGD